MSRGNDVMDIIDQIDADEYEALFPFEQEYNLWVESVERDFQEEADRRVEEAEKELAL